MDKPLIALGADLALHQQTRERVFVYAPYIEALKRAGAVPLIVPPQPENVPALAGVIDGIVLVGGYDCDPALYGEEPHSTVEKMDRRRQENDLALARLGLEHGIPLLGICLGLQVINVVSGGTLVQDIDSQHPTTIRHDSAPGDRVRHHVEVREGTRLAAIIGAGDHDVNSSHHQAVKDPAKDFEVVARAPDGIIEAIENPRHGFCLGVQWHPEDMPGENTAERLFTALADAARAYRRRRDSLRRGDLTEAISE